ncbi:uncharacterized protein LOC127048745 [Gopherus flavomarginatus]|uniref:uncharacterized protein LOC127048745 n=1 Tax=Gopherus flavomarginatus TaxID=286002 RepID=UPI0021CC235B|nr:uncharacterized protein LOC127048745 [Gopherus flavomarginatus]
MDSPPVLCFPAHPADSQSSHQGAQRQSPGDSHSSSVGQTALVSHVAGPLSSQPSYPAPSSGPDHSGPRQALSPGPSVSSPDGMAPAWLTDSELRCSTPVHEVLMGSRKPSTRATYTAKWKRFSCWCSEKALRPTETPVTTLLDYIWSLKTQGLALSSLRVHLAAISAFHPGVDGCSVFSHPMVARFLKGLERLYPQIRPPAPSWDLNLVLTRLMAPPFEPLATCSLLYLSWKTAFLVAITSAR